MEGENKGPKPLAPQGMQSLMESEVRKLGWKTNTIKPLIMIYIPEEWLFFYWVLDWDSYCAFLLTILLVVTNSFCFFSQPSLS